MSREHQAFAVTAAAMCLAASPLAVPVAGAAHTEHPVASTAARSRTLHLTAADSGRTFKVLRHRRVVVRLRPDGGSYDPVKVSNRRVLHEDSHHGGYPTDTTAVAELTTRHHGTSRLTSRTDVACLHATPPCLPPQREFTVTIKVRRR